MIKKINDDYFLYSVSKDFQIKVHDIKNKKTIKSFYLYRDENNYKNNMINSAHFSENFIYFCYNDGHVIKFDL